MRTSDENKIVRDKCVPMVCTNCGESFTLQVNSKMYSMWQKLKMPIDSCFTGENRYVRTALLSGVCFRCQAKQFGESESIGVVQDGRYLGRCRCCGRPVYALKNRHRNHIECGYCGRIWEVPV